MKPNSLASKMKFSFMIFVWAPSKCQDSICEYPLVLLVDMPSL